MKRYIPNFLLAAATTIFFYSGIQSCAQGNNYAREAAAIKEVNNSHQIYQKESLNNDAKRARIKGAARLGFGGLFLLISGANANRMRKQKKLEDTVDESN
jgi:hypothetical protein